MTKKLTFIFCLILLCASMNTSLKAQSPFQTPSAKKVMKTTFDTTKAQGFAYGLKTGLITNEDIAFPLIVYFSYPGKKYLDSNSLVIIPPGKTFKYTTHGQNIFRRTTVNDEWKISQVLQGKEIDTKGKMSFQGIVYQGRDFTGAIIQNMDLTGCNFVGCNFLNAKIVNCILEDCDFVDASNISDEDLVTACGDRKDGANYTFTGVQGDTINK